MVSPGTADSLGETKTETYLLGCLHGFVGVVSVVGSVRGSIRVEGLAAVIQGEEMGGRMNRSASGLSSCALLFASARGQLS